MNPLVTIVMPAYNAEKYIHEAIASVVAQTYGNWQLIVIDDCSLDNTHEIALGFGDARIKVVRNMTNRGIAYGRTKGIALADGEWIAFLDADDMWEKDKLQKQISLLAKRKDAVLLYCGSAFMDENGNRLKYTLPAKEEIGYRDLLKQNIISCSSALARKDVLREIPFPMDDCIHEDFAVWLAILRRGYKAFGVDEPLLVYRLSGKQKSADKRRAALMNWHTYRFIGVPFGLALASMFAYGVNGIVKYGRLAKNEA